MNEISLSGQVAVVTGAGKGLGRAHAVELARLGAAVVVNDVDGGGTPGGSPADDVVREITDGGGRAVVSHESVSTPEGGRAIIQAAIDSFGTIDIVVNNAGFLRNAYFEDMTVGDLNEVLDVHLRGAFYVTQPAWPVMQSKGYGRVVFTASGAGFFGREAGANYCAAKAGLHGLSRCLSIEGAEYGILVNCVLPAARTTIGQTSPMPERYRAKQATRVAARKVPDDRRRPELVSPLVAYLSSPECKVTGEAFSAVLGRYAVAFTGVGPGWIAPEDDIPSAADIAEHLPEIENRDGYILPATVFEELSAVAELVRD
jgi:NAD(P)-dependent dehydrogenase (short-subunit alcohol dehydrogenase family)